MRRRRRRSRVSPALELTGNAKRNYGSDNDAAQQAYERDRPACESGAAAMISHANFFENAIALLV